MEIKIKQKLKKIKISQISLVRKININPKKRKERKRQIKRNPL